MARSVRRHHPIVERVPIPKRTSACSFGDGRRSPEGEDSDDHSDQGDQGHGGGDDPGQRSTSGFPGRPESHRRRRPTRAAPRRSRGARTRRRWRRRMDPRRHPEQRRESGSACNGGQCRPVGLGSLTAASITSVTVLAVERPRPVEHLEQHAAERPEVRALVPGRPFACSGACRRRCQDSATSVPASASVGSATAIGGA